MCPPAGTSASSIVVAAFMPLLDSRQSSAPSSACVGKTYQSDQEAVLRPLLRLLGVVLVRSSSHPIM